MTNNDIRKIIDNYIATSNDAYQFDKNPDRKKELESIVQLYAKRMALLIDSRYANRQEIKHLVDAQNESMFFFELPMVEEIYQAVAKELDEQKKGNILSVLSLEQKILTLYKEKPDEGLAFSARYSNLSAHYRFKIGQLNIVTGIPSHGKSEMLDMLLCDLAIEHDLKFAIFSPENYPHELHLIKLVSKIMGKSFYPCADPRKRMTEEELVAAIEFVNNHFYFLDPYENDVSLKAILSLALEAKEKHGISAFVIDPWNEIEHDIPMHKNESTYTGECLTTIRRFGRKHGMSPFIVAHPTKLLPPKAGEAFPIPNAYNIAGSAMWYNKADNILSVYRNADDTVDLYIQKIKFKQFGKKGVVNFNYDFHTGVYSEN